MKNGLFYKFYFFILIFGFLALLNIKSMEQISLTTEEISYVDNNQHSSDYGKRAVLEPEQELVLDADLVPTKSLELIKKNRDLLDKKLSLNAWRVIFDIFSVTRFIEFNKDFELNFKNQNNPFNRHKLTQEEAKKFLVLLLNLIEKDSPILKELIESFIVFTKGEVKFLENLKLVDNDLKPLLDKYLYLNFDKHFKLKDKEIGYINFQEALDYNKITSKRIKVGKDPIESKEIKLILSQLYLSSLLGWQNLFKKITLNLDKENIVSIDLSHNALENVEEDFLKGLVNLNKLILAHNKLSSFPDNLIEDSQYLEFLDISHNNLKSISMDIIKLGITLFLNNNPLEKDTLENIQKIEKELVGNSQIRLQYVEPDYNQNIKLEIGIAVAVMLVTAVVVKIFSNK